ncbi:hypothetical protein [Pontibacter akesuensis]|uniref:Uncharacterized protein n=1 Tax=Pontibacter akesuensis TaxID=388950 RepID=A0A1I7JFP5_9BACT|nr:hypothetical protein [Pontibacter akesuensis]GHA70285.1 hypothetical protein GCM10007389_24470 [Pontibacter akesuensis]SFU83998.1 hypothetical protein SAMN04487941_2822 [Pontibacter akesuensis]
MEAAAIFFRFKDNLAVVAGALNSKLEVRSMPYNTSIPLEIDLLAHVLRLHGLDFQSPAVGLARLYDFQQWYAQHEEQVNEVMQRVLEDKKAFMKTATGVVLQKEMLYRRLEYFKETAHTLDVMMIQQNLHSPKHFSYPFLNA